jgi:hypothetical protein
MKAIEAANLANTSGLYIIRPRWAGRRALYKFGLTRNVTRRMLSSYRHSWPYAAGSFEIVAFLRVGESGLFKRERKLMALSNPGFGINKPDRDLEWREAAAHNPEQIFELLRAVRTQVDGNFYIFDRSTGAVSRQGGGPPVVNVANALPLGSTMLTRGTRDARLVATNVRTHRRRFGIDLPKTEDRPGLHIRQLRSRPTVRY